MAKKIKKDDFLLYAYDILYKNWPRVTKKFGLREDVFLKPDIKFIKRTYSEYDDGVLRLSYQDMLDSYNRKKVIAQGLEVKCEDIFKDDIIHEAVHYIQDQFYDLEENRYSYISEGLACMVSIDLLSEAGAYNFVTTELTGYFAETKKEYKDYFGLPEECNKHIERFLKKSCYKPPKRDHAYAKGLTFICEMFGRCDNYLELVIHPFENPEVG